MPKPASLAEYVRKNLTFIDRAADRGVTYAATAANLSKRAGARWSPKQILKSIYSTRHRQKVRVPTAEEERILAGLERDFRPLVNDDPAIGAQGHLALTPAVAAIATGEHTGANGAASSRAGSREDLLN